MFKNRLTVFSLAVVPLIYGCSDGSDNTMNGASHNQSEPPLQDLYDQGVDRYLGEFTPMTSAVYPIAT